MVNKYLVVGMLLLVAVVAYIVGKRAEWHREMNKWQYLLDVMEEATDKLTERDATYYVIQGAMLSYDVVVNEKEIEIIEK